jgi:hypothetical protein
MNGGYYQAEACYLRVEACAGKEQFNLAREWENCEARLAE